VLLRGGCLRTCVFTYAQLGQTCSLKLPTPMDIASSTGSTSRGTRSPSSMLASQFGQFDCGICDCRRSQGHSGYTGTRSLVPVGGHYGPVRRYVTPQSQRGGNGRWRSPTKRGTPRRMEGCEEFRTGGERGRSVSTRSPRSKIVPGTRWPARPRREGLSCQTRVRVVKLAR